MSKRNTTTAKDQIVNVDMSLGVALKIGARAWLTAGVTVLKVTEKAVQIGAEDTKIKLWIPRAALVADLDTPSNSESRDGLTHCYEIASWFTNKMSADEYKWFDLFFRATGHFVG